MRRSLRSWLWRVPIDQEVDEELAFHLEMRRREGKPLAAADVERVRRACLEIARKRDREMRLTQWLDDVAADIRFACRQMRASPGFTFVATLTLALGIGANSAIFALADVTLLRPLPFADPGRVVAVVERTAATPRLPLLGPAEPVAREIVGVLRRVTTLPYEVEAPAQIYVPLAQNPWIVARLVVQTDGPAEALAPSVRAAIARVDKDRAVTLVRTMDDVSREATARQRFRAVLVITFAALALMLAMIGVFGVLAYSVQQRLREFGVRMALGASAADVLRLVLVSAARVAGIGSLIGLIAAAVLSRWVATLLFGVQPLDPVTYASAAALLGITAAIAAVAPALRAARVDPAVAFRQE